MAKYEPDEFGCYFIGFAKSRAEWYCLSLHGTCGSCFAKDVPVFNGGSEPKALSRRLDGQWCRKCQLTYNENGLTTAVTAFFIEMFNEDPSSLLES